MKKKLIYIAGPYRPCSTNGYWHGTPENVVKAELVAIDWIKRGWYAICPHKNTQFYDFYEKYLNIEPTFWLEMDKEILCRCDAIAFMYTGRFSSGARKELELARKLGLEVYIEQIGGTWLLENGNAPFDISMQ